MMNSISAKLRLSVIVCLFFALPAYSEELQKAEKDCDDVRSHENYCAGDTVRDSYCDPVARSEHYHANRKEQVARKQLAIIKEAISKKSNPDSDDQGSCCVQ